MQIRTGKILLVVMAVVAMLLLIALIEEVRASDVDSTSESSIMALACAGATDNYVVKSGGFKMSHYELLGEISDNVWLINYHFNLSENKTVTYTKYCAYNERSGLLVPMFKSSLEAKSFAEVN